MSKEVKYIRKVGDRAFLFETYEQPLRTQIKQLKQQLAEKQKTIDEINKEFVQAIHDWKALCAEKDKEIEDWKQKTQTFLNRVNEQNYEIANNNPKQLAIQELEKVKDWLNEPFDEDGCFKNGGDLIDYLDQQIKELKGEKDVED